MYHIIEVKSSKRTEMIEISDRLSELIKKDKIKSGLLALFCPHTTCAITVNENYDPTVKEDIMTMLAKYFPHSYHYAHTEGNADAHIKTSVIGSSQILFVENGALVLGTWQGVFLCEFDGPRTRKILVKIIPDKTDI
ncbi:MAG: secondary thiamine-phosphate synthase enzyme YjbQ [candidate division WOR-3 bacterium]|nr:secondary thiamine-phosphate synthase enzyme YjbQ [candidate division WOR-3 bacterium]MCX7757567.1 secondary thiamine-phosphate synthase enzyme YjbQ [candidate division WOR-3 bacterium]MDW7987541.1 secondary thiamine-phosphate synthase enzyme YjbQ [candidate division WOR-3 bacterium]